MPLNPLAFDSEEQFVKALNEEGFKRGYTPFTSADDILEHHGVKGMHWGVRKQVHPDIAHIPRKTRKEAAKDAEEFTRAKLFFGVGAGTRRKLIKAKVESKKEKDPLYAKAFDHFVKQTDLGKRASQAKKERKRKDVTTHTKKTAKGVGHVLRGNPQYSNTSSQVAVGLGKALLKNLQQSDDPVGDILEHHGVKGMHWGISRNKPSGPQSVVVSDRRKKIKTFGGQGHAAHPDAVRARTSGQIAKKSGVKSLSNAELKAYNERLNLEQNFKRLEFQDKSGGAKFVATLLRKKGPGTAESIGKTAINSPKVRSKVAARVAAIAIAAA
jgi:hypothetical protein